MTEQPTPADVVQPVDEAELPLPDTDPVPVDTEPVSVEEEDK